MPLMKAEIPARSKLRTNGTSPHQVHQNNINGWISSNLLDLEKVVGQVYGMLLTELRVTRQEDCWRVMLKAKKGRIPYVAFIHIIEWDDAIEFALWMAETRQMAFKVDRYPVRVKPQKAWEDKP